MMTGDQIVADTFNYENTRDGLDDICLWVVGSIAKYQHWVDWPPCPPHDKEPPNDQ